MKRVILLALLALALPMAASADGIFGPFYTGTGTISGPGFSYSTTVIPAQVGQCTIVFSDFGGCSNLRQGAFCCYTLRDYNTELTVDTSSGFVSFTEFFPDHSFGFFDAALGATTITQHGDMVELFGEIPPGPNFGFGPPLDTVPPGTFVTMDLTLVPEPGTLVLLGTGVIVLLAGMARRRLKLGT